jgi:hypothetical protein
MFGMATKLIFPLTTLLTLAVLACGGDDKSSDEDPAALLARSVKAVQDVTSFHFKLDHENGATPMPLGLELTSAEGDVAVPDRLKAEVRARAAAVSVTLQVVAIADKTWVTNPFNRRWQELPGASLSDIADPASLMTVLVQNLQDVRVTGEIEIDGERGYRLQGTLDSGVLRVALPNAREGQTVNVDLWLNAADALPRRARLEGPLAAGENEDIVREVQFSRFNAGVEITAPTVN